MRNLAAVCGISEHKMEEIIANFKRELPALTALIDKIQAQGEAYGYLLSVDGRWGRIRSRDKKLLVHTMLNVLLQMTGSLSMKYGLCFAERQMVAEGVGLDELGHPAWVTNSHDELQMEVNEVDVLYLGYEIPIADWKSEEKRVHVDDDGRMWSAPKKLATKDESIIFVSRSYHRAGQIIAESMTKAGEFLKLRCPLAGEYKIGKSWADTH